MSMRSTETSAQIQHLLQELDDITAHEQSASGLAGFIMRGVHFDSTRLGIIDALRSNIEALQGTLVSQDATQALSTTNQEQLEKIRKAIQVLKDSRKATS